LSEKFQRINLETNELPKLVDRMNSLQKVHEESAELILSLNNLKEIQNFIASSIDENKEILSIFREKFEGNITLMEKNLALLSERLEKYN
jgi:hypothetical protein